METLHKPSGLGERFKVVIIIPYDDVRSDRLEDGPKEINRFVRSGSVSEGSHVYF
jgi:hypothetical protein